MIITVASTKGGPGKTTLSLCLADHWHRAGRTVEVLDVDPNRNLSQWLWCINRFRLPAGAGMEAAPLPRARMPYKHNEPRRHKIPKARESIKNRGALARLG